MQSTFYPVANTNHAIKVVSSVQEWCGQIYTQLNNRDNYEVTSHSYFQGEADRAFKLEKSWTENELWTKLRIDPKSLPTGEISSIPSLEYLTLKHKPIKAYKAEAILTNGTYTISYPELERNLKLVFNPNFPYDIQSWEETIPSGFGNSGKPITTKATKITSLKSAYWGKKSVEDETLRAQLKL